MPCLSSIVGERQPFEYRAGRGAGEAVAGAAAPIFVSLVFVPGTIGPITWLALNEDKTANIKHGLVLTCVGDAGQVTYKRSRRGAAEIDRAAVLALKASGHPHRVIDFYPYGYDERQYCSPGFNLAVGCFFRGMTTWTSVRRKGSSRRSLALECMSWA